VPLADLDDLIFAPFIADLLLFVPGFTGFAAGLPVTANNPAGTIVPTNTSQTLLNQFANKCNPVVYSPRSNSFVVLECGLYEICYYIQGMFLVACPVGIQFGVFVNGQLVRSSVTRATTGIVSGNSFNISKCFCLFFDKDTCLQECQDSLLPNSQPNSVQVRAIIDNNSTLTCLSFITTATQIGTTTQPSTNLLLPTYALGTGGALLPNNAFEIVFKKIGDTCM
jgi:hypothetical protein